MAGKNREQAPSLKERLVESGELFSFVQSLRLLRLLLKDDGKDGLHKGEIGKRIRVRPDLNLDFPKSDITAIEEMPGDPPYYRITATFLGLYGTSSPLPTFYTEDLLEEQSDGMSVTRDFIDILNHPLYSLFFNCWTKYRLFYTVVEEPNEEVIDRLFSLVGLEDETFRGKVEDPYTLIRYTGLLTQFPRSAEGLRSILVDSLNEPSITVVQCVPRVTDIPADQRCIIGKSGNRLGNNSYLGFEIADMSGKFRIQAGPLDSVAFHRFLPDSQVYHKMKLMTRFYLDQPLEYDMELFIDSTHVQTARLGSDRWSQLGWNTWVFSEKLEEGTLSVQLTERE